MLVAVLSCAPLHTLTQYFLAVVLACWPEPMVAIAARLWIMLTIVPAIVYVYSLLLLGSNACNPMAALAVLTSAFKGLA